jgi:TATA-binding protein-associated factor Taf7
MWRGSAAAAGDEDEDDEDDEDEDEDESESDVESDVERPPSKRYVYTVYLHHHAVESKATHRIYV